MVDKHPTVSNQNESSQAAAVFSIFASEWRPLFYSFALAREPVDKVRDHMRNDEGELIGAWHDNRRKLTEVHQIITEVETCEICNTITDGIGCEDHPNAGTEMCFELTELGRRYKEAFNEFLEERFLMCDSVKNLLKGMPDGTKANIGNINFLPPLEEIAKEVDVTWNPKPRSLNRYGERVNPIFQDSNRFKCILPFKPFDTKTLQSLITEESVESSFVFGQTFLEEKDKMHNVNRVLEIGASEQNTDLMGIKRRLPYVLAIGENDEMGEVFLLGTGNYGDTVAMCFQTDNKAIVDFANDLYETIVEESEQVSVP